MNLSDVPLDPSDFIALAALAVSLWSLEQSRRVNSTNTSLQERITQIEESRRNEEIARATQADIHATLRRGDPRLRVGYVLVITNSGGATAEQVSVQISPAPGARIGPTLVGSPFPIAALHAGDQVTSELAFGAASQRIFDATISWKDGRGPQAKIQTVTLSSW
jgi:hypothetical protein